MCTTIAEKLPISGSGKGPKGWFDVDHVYIAYDHPFHAPLEHALSLGFVSEANPAGRVAVELSLADTKRLVERLLAVLESADEVEA